METEIEAIRQLSTDLKVEDLTKMAIANIKARAKGDARLVDQVYSGVPASWLGREHEIELGPMSGRSNAIHLLEARGLPRDRATIDFVLSRAKRADRILGAREIEDLLGELAVREQATT